MADSLMDLAPELLELILVYLSPCHLLRFGQTCQRAQAFVQPNNQILWKAAFLQVFDSPKHAWDTLNPTARAANRSREAQWDWHRETHRRCSAFASVCQDSTTSLLAHLEDYMTALLDVAETASLRNVVGESKKRSLNIEFLDRLFHTAPNAEKIVHDYHRDIESASLPIEFMADANRPITRSMMRRASPIPEWASRFHIFYGMTEREGESLRAKGCARAVVYDWAVTGENADYGPFNKDGTGTVNWQLLEAIASLMLRIFDGIRSSSYRLPTGFKSHIPRSLPPDPFEADDWAGASRQWVGTYAFLDYRQLVHYNFANNMEYHMDLGTYEEASGDVMRLQLQLDMSKEMRDDFRLHTNLPVCKDLPPVYFRGTSRGRSAGRPSILVRGMACLVPGGRQVRWRFIISYAGADQWQLEGVQPSGIRSGGIYGMWSHVDHDDNGPTGPFAYFPSEICQLKF